MERVYVYGTGQFWTKYKSRVLKEYNVVGYMNSLPHDGIEVPNAKNLLKDEYDAILVMVESIHMCFEITNNLLTLVGGEKRFFGKQKDRMGRYQIRKRIGRKDR